MIKIESNIDRAIERVQKLKLEIPKVILRVVSDEEHWRSRAREIASAALTGQEGVQPEMIPGFIDRIVAQKGVTEIPEMTISISGIATESDDSDPTSGFLKEGVGIPLALVEVWKAAFLSNPTIAREVIYDWVASHTKDLTVIDIPGGNAGGAFDYQRTARNIFEIVFDEMDASSLLDSEAEVGSHGGGGGARLLDYFAQHPLTKGLVPEAQSMMATEWLAIVLAAWREFIPEEMVVKLQEEIAVL